MFAVIKVNCHSHYTRSVTALYKENSYTAEIFSSTNSLWCFSWFNGMFLAILLCTLVGHNIIQNFYLAKVYSPFLMTQMRPLYFAHILCFTSTLNPYYKFRKLFIFITVALIILTLSRAAIGAILFVMIEIVRKFNRSRKY